MILRVRCGIDTPPMIQPKAIDNMALEATTCKLLVINCFRLDFVYYRSMFRRFCRLQNGGRLLIAEKVFR